MAEQIQLITRGASFDYSCDSDDIHAEYLLENGNDGESVGVGSENKRFELWARKFRRSDPRYQILNFFNDVAEEGTVSLTQRGFSAISIMPLIRTFYKSSVFTVWRPTSYDAIRKMMLGEGVGKGLDIKGKSAKRGKLSGFVPFMQIHQEEHKKEVRTLRKDGKIRIFYHSRQDRERVVKFLEGVAKEMVDAVKKAREIVADKSIDDDETNEWALSKLIWDMTDSSIHAINNYKPKLFGIEVPERVFWEGLVVRQDIHREANSEDDVGRASVPSFQDMNFAALRPHDKKPTRQAVILQYRGHGDEQDPLDPRNLLMAYEENHRVMPVVSDFDCFLLGTRGVKYRQPLPDDQVAVSKWCVDQIESILESEADSGSSWTNRWLDVLKNAASGGFYPDVPPLGFSDPKSHSIMKHAIYRLRKDGSVRHGAECFNYYFPQELDDEFLVVSDRLPGTSLAWKYVDQQGLREILMEKIDQGYTFPINPKWVLCDPGWKDVLDKLVASKADHVQDSLRAWYPPESGLLEKMDDICKRFPNGFEQNTLNHRGSMMEGTEAMDLAEMELKNYMALQRAKRKLRCYLIMRRMLEDIRKKSPSGTAYEGFETSARDEKDHDDTSGITGTSAAKKEDLEVKQHTEDSDKSSGKELAPVTHDSLEEDAKLVEEHEIPRFKKLTSLKAFANFLKRGMSTTLRCFRPQQESESSEPRASADSNKVGVNEAGDMSDADAGPTSSKAKKHKRSKHRWWHNSKSLLIVKQSEYEGDEEYWC